MSAEWKLLPQAPAMGPVGPTGPRSRDSLYPGAVLDGQLDSEREISHGGFVKSHDRALKSHGLPVKSHGGRKGQKSRAVRGNLVNPVGKLACRHFANVWHFAAAKAFALFVAKTENPPLFTLLS